MCYFYNLGPGRHTCYSPSLILAGTFPFPVACFWYSHLNLEVMNQNHCMSYSLVFESWTWAFDSVSLLYRYYSWTWALNQVGNVRQFCFCCVSILFSLTCDNFEENNSCLCYFQSKSLDSSLFLVGSLLWSSFPLYHNCLEVLFIHPYLQSRFAYNLLCCHTGFIYWKLLKMWQTLDHLVHG